MDKFDKSAIQAAAEDWYNVTRRPQAPPLYVTGVASLHTDSDDFTRGLDLPDPVEVLTIINGKSYLPMKFLPMDLVKNFKEDVTMLVTDMPTSMEASYKGKIMLDDEPMQTYKIKSGGKVVVTSMKTPQPDAFYPTLEVTTVIDGVWKHGLEVDLVTTMLVREFKDKVAELVPEMPMSMEAFHKGAIMLDHSEVGSYNIKDGDKIVMHSVKTPQDYQDAELHMVPVPGEAGYMLVTRQEPHVMSKNIFYEYSSSWINSIFLESTASSINMKKKSTAPSNNLNKKVPPLGDYEEFPGVVERGGYAAKEEESFSSSRWKQ